MSRRRVGARWGVGGCKGHLHVETPKEGAAAAALFDAIQIDEYGAHALPASGAERPARLRVGVDAVEVVNVALVVSVPRHLGQLHVPQGLARQTLDLMEQRCARGRVLGWGVGWGRVGGRVG